MTLETLPNYQLKIELAPEHLRLAISGSFGGPDVADFMRAIDAKLNSNPSIKNILFDLRHIDALYNAAGRLVDLANYYHASKRASVEVKMPKEIYSALVGLPQHKIVANSTLRGDESGLFVSFSRAANCIDLYPKPGQGKIHIKSLAPPAFPKILLSCKGKINSVYDSEVTVTLFMLDEKVIGEFSRTQFPDTELVPGTIFTYKAVVIEPGNTQVMIDLLPKQQPSNEALMDMAKEVRRFFGDINLDEI